MKTLVVTACGAKKHKVPMEAYKLYKSSRIKAVYNRRKGCDMAILSAKYGLVDASAIIEPYDAKMTEESVIKIMPLMVEKLKEYEKIVFYKGGSNKLYLKCIEKACLNAKKTLISVGYANLGDIQKLPALLEE